MALVGMEVHLAVGQRADQPAILPYVRDQHHGRMAGPVLGRMNRGRRAETFGEADLVFHREPLVAQQENQALVPDVLQCCRQGGVDGRARVHVQNLHPERGRQRTRHERHTRPGVGAVSGRTLSFHWASSIVACFAVMTAAALLRPGCRYLLRL